MLGNEQLLASRPPSQDMEFSGHTTLHEAGHTLPSVPLSIGTQILGFAHPVMLSVPPGQVL